MWPNGEASVGYQPPAKKKTVAKQESRYEDDLEAQRKRQAALKFAGKFPGVVKGLTRGQRLAIALEEHPSHEDIALERRKQSRRRGRRGLKGITTYGSKMVRNGCYTLEKWLGKQRLGFLTLTLPSNPSVKWLFVHNWSELVRKFVQSLRRKLEARGALTTVVYVTEIQEGRSRKEGMLVPHLHLVFESWDGKSYHDNGKRKYYFSWSELQKLWQRILQNEVKRVGLEGDVGPFDQARVEVKGVKKSVEGYLGKYMTKGRKAVEKLVNDGFDHRDFPKSWWGCDNELRHAIHSAIEPLPRDITLAVVKGVDLVARGVVRYLNVVKIQLKSTDGPIDKTVGYALRLTRQWHEALQQEAIETG